MRRDDGSANVGRSTTSAGADRIAMVRDADGAAAGLDDRLALA